MPRRESSDSRARGTGVTWQPASAVYQPRSGRASLTTSKRTPSTVTGSPEAERSDRRTICGLPASAPFDSALSGLETSLFRARRVSSDGSLKRLSGIT